MKYTLLTIAILLLASSYAWRIQNKLQTHDPDPQACTELDALDQQYAPIDEECWDGQVNEILAAGGDPHADFNHDTYQTCVADGMGYETYQALDDAFVSLLKQCRGWN